MPGIENAGTERILMVMKPFPSHVKEPGSHGPTHAPEYPKAITAAARPVPGYELFSFTLLRAGVLERIHHAPNLKGHANLGEELGRKRRQGGI